MVGPPNRQEVFVSLGTLNSGVQPKYAQRGSFSGLRLRQRLLRAKRRWLGGDFTVGMIFRVSYFLAWSFLGAVDVSWIAGM